MSPAVWIPSMYSVDQHNLTLRPDDLGHLLFVLVLPNRELRDFGLPYMKLYRVRIITGAGSVRFEI